VAEVKGDPKLVEIAILQAVAYADIFDYPLTTNEVHRFLVGVETSPPVVEMALDSGRLTADHLGRRGEYVFLAGREGIVETRLRRNAVAAGQWPRALRYGSILARLPFVRMVAVTGAMSMNNVEPATDIDYLIVTTPGRLWVGRAMVVALVRWAAQKGDTICPNYFLSERALTMKTRNLFTAHELAQMVPISGLRTYVQLCRLNGWAAQFLPNAFPLARARYSPPCIPHPNDVDRLPLGWHYSRSLVEATLQTPIGSWVERWEMRRKVRKLTGETGSCCCPSQVPGDEPETEVAFSPDRCKGHFDRHSQRTQEAFNCRLRDRSIQFPAAGDTSDVHGSTGSMRIGAHA